MRFLIGLLIAIVFALVFREPLKRFPLAFYLLAVLCGVLLMYGVYYGLPAWTWKTILNPLQKNTIAMGLFTVVMFIGVLKKGSKLYSYLMPVRAELSIIACLLSLGHCLIFIQTYYLRLSTSFSIMTFYQVAAVICSAVFLLLMIPLLITSFKRIHFMMLAPSWKKLQVLAYPFYILLFVHIFLFLGPSLQAGNNTSTLLNVALYATICLAYVVLRVLRYRADARVQLGLEL